VSRNRKPHQTQWDLMQVQTLAYFLSNNYAFNLQTNAFGGFQSKIFVNQKI
jgi:hypothetical protein